MIKRKEGIGDDIRSMLLLKGIGLQKKLLPVFLDRRCYAALAVAGLSLSCQRGAPFRAAGMPFVNPAHRSPCAEATGPEQSRISDESV